MKIVLTYILLLTMALRPLYVIGNIMYYQLNTDYIIENYCINKAKPKLNCKGKCHLAKQLQITNKTPNTNTKQLSNILTEAFYPTFFKAENNYQCCYTSLMLKKKKTYSSISNYAYLYIHNTLKPPINA